MLIKLHIENFRRLRDRQVLSFAACPDRSRREENTWPADLPGSRRLIRSLLVYGGNGSGRSVITDALRLLSVAATGVGRVPDVAPFAPDPDTRSRPVFARADFLSGGRRFTYALELAPGSGGPAEDADPSPCLRSEGVQGAIGRRLRLVSERLLVWRTNTPTLLYGYAPDGNGAHTVHCHRVFGPRAVAAAADPASRGDLPFLRRLLYGRATKGVRGAALVGSLRTFFDSLRFLCADDFERAEESALTDLATDAGLRGRVGALARGAGLGIEAVDVAEGADGSDIAAGEAAERLVFTCGGLPRSHAQLGRGTREGLLIATRAARTAERGGLLVCDGLDGVHPKTLSALLDLFHQKLPAEPTLPMAPDAVTGALPSAERVVGPGQLLLVTNATHFMSRVGEAVRRDQIWFVDASAEGGSELFSLASFAPRKTDAVERRYFKGQYGALPGTPYEPDANDAPETRDTAGEETDGALEALPGTGSADRADLADRAAGPDSMNNADRKSKDTVFEDD